MDYNGHWFWFPLANHLQKAEYMSKKDCAVPALSTLDSLVLIIKPRSELGILV